MHVSRIESDGLFYRARIIYTDNHHEQKEEVLGSYSRQADAEHAARAHKRDWLIGAITRYCNHKQFLFEGSDSSFYNARDKVNSLRICLGYSREFKHYSLEQIAMKMLQEEGHFLHILPSPTNSSHHSSLEALKDILDVCHRIRRVQRQMVA